MAIVFSGIQPTGSLTIGNYLGTMKNWLKLQDEHSCIYSVVDLHAITVQQNPQELRDACLMNIALYLASGIDPNKSIIFIQSAVSAHAELGWILGCNAPLGWLNRMVQFKDKAGKDKEKACLGLYSYPVLQAADIVLYNTELVPVGEDQMQHIELARDIAGAFNRNFATDCLVEPKALIEGVAMRIMSLRDGNKKMSKSDESDYSRINMFDSEDTIVQKIKKAKTDMVEGIYFDRENRPEISNLLNIYSSFANVSIDEAVGHFENSKTSQFKEGLAQAIIETLIPIQKTANIYLEDKNALLKIAKEGGQKASAIADVTLKKVKEIIGLSY